MLEEVERFFRSYRDAYNRLDASGIAAHIAVPSLLAEGDCIVWTAKEQVLDNMERLLVSYRRNSFKRADFTIAQLVPQGVSNVVANVLWTVERHNESVPWRFHTGYNLRRFAEGWRIILCTAYEEQLLRESAP